MRWLLGLVLLLLALGTLRVVGCGEEIQEIPCEERMDCGELVKVEGYYVLADDRCTAVWCTDRQVCLFQSLDCQNKYMTNFGCRRVEFIECNPDAEEPCGTLRPINEGRPCSPNCTNMICRDGECVCSAPWACWCGLP